MQGNFNPADPNNPYASSGFIGRVDAERTHPYRAIVMPPAICLVLVGLLGLTVSALNVAFAVVAEPPKVVDPAEVDPNMPAGLRKFLENAEKSGRGPVAMVVHSAFVFVNLLIVAGGVQMLRFQTRGLAVTSSILAILNFGSCCCLLGVPVGIWSLVVLNRPDVTWAFQAASE